jgi:transcriptional regulator GlxA family with amidase domain
MPLLDRQSLFPVPPPMPDVDPDIRVGFVLSPRFTLLPFASFIDSLRHAADEADFGRQIYCRWKVVAPSLLPVRASCGVEVTPHELFPDPGQFDYLVIVGGQLPWCLDHPEETLAYLRRAYAANVSIVGLCTGSFVLAKAGLLNERRCAVHFEHRNQLAQLFPRCRPETDQIYVNDNEVITCPGGTSALDLAFALIEARCGKARAVKGLTSLLVDRHRAAHHMPPRSYGHLATCGNRLVEQAVALMEQQISAPTGIAALARRLNDSERELNRVFRHHAGEAPSAVWRKMRLAHGHWLLLNTTRTVTQIALECGFADGAHFSRWFHRAYKEAPVALRRRHRQRASGTAR